MHKPAYLQEGFCRGPDDIGDTYIEVDMGQQRMYYYQNGECLVSVDVVTGNARNITTGVPFSTSSYNSLITSGGVLIQPWDPLVR